MVRVERDLVVNCMQLFLLFSNKGAFLITQKSEYETAGVTFERFSNAVSVKGNMIDVDVEDLKFAAAAIDMCTGRTPVDIKNFRFIADLRDKLDKFINDESKPAVEEMKTDM